MTESSDYDHNDLALLYQTGELDLQARKDFQTHLRDCRSCRRILDDATWASNLARSAALMPPDSAIIRLCARIRRDAVPWIRWTQTAAAGLALAAAIFLIRGSHVSTSSLTTNAGLESELLDLDQRLENLDSNLSSDAWNVEFSQSWEDLQLRQKSLDSQLSRTEEA